MSERKHTPGPWIARRATGEDNCIATLASNSRGGIPTCLWEILPEAGHAMTTRQQAANARLIATAPELLDALTDLVGGCGKEGDLFSSEAMEKARAAIAKAEGGEA